MVIQKLESSIDSSVNFVEPWFDGGAYESRYVRRSDDYFIVYLSSQTGCQKACRFCHLTATKQTMAEPALLTDYQAQVQRVMRHYDHQTPAERVHFNWMARGEPLSNQHFVDHWPSIANMLIELSHARNLKPRFNISTIMPTEAERVDLPYSFEGEVLPTFYYSLYSLEESFRKRWLPKAMNPLKALDKLRHWQEATNAEVALHWAFIEGQNDSEETVRNIIRAVNERNLRVKFNLVRYNAYSERQGKESSFEVIQRNFDMLKDAFGNKDSRIVPRVGFDVAASCGMFVNPHNQAA